MGQQFLIDGSQVTNIATLYQELNRLLMANQDWQLGQSLDALNDALYQLDSSGAEFTWVDHESSRAALGVSETRRWLEEKIAAPEIFNTVVVKQQLAGLLAGEGQTYFDLVLEVFADHPKILLQLS